MVPKSDGCVYLSFYTNHYFVRETGSDKKSIKSLQSYLFCCIPKSLTTIQISSNLGDHHLGLGFHTVSAYSSLNKELLKEIHVALAVGTKVIFESQRCARILHVAVMKI